MIDKELKNKIIIRNYTNKDDLEIMQYIKTVIYEGKNSIVNGKKQYCLVTIFNDNTKVYCNRSGNTHTFYIEGE